MKRFFWINIYGAQIGGDEKYSKLMNTHPALGSYWKGRIFMAISSYQEDNPKLTSDKISKEIINENKSSDVISWLFIAEVFYGINFPEKNEKYSIQIRWADQEISFDKIVIKLYENL